MPGAISALVADAQAVWVCGESPKGKGYLVRVEPTRGGELVKTIAHSLEAPCRALTLRGSGLALWLDQGKALWLGEPLDPSGRPTTTRLLHRFNQATPQRPRRAIWSPVHESFFVTTDKGRVLRFEIRANSLVEDPTFSSPAQHVQDIARSGATLIIADADQGILAWDPADADIQARWPQAESAFRLESHRPINRIITGPGGRIFAGASASLLELAWNADSSEFSLVADHSTYEPPLDLVSDPQGPLTLTATRLWQSDSLLHQRFPELDQSSPMLAIAKHSDEHLWIAAGHTLEFSPLPSQEPRARIVPLASKVSDSGHAEIPFLVEGQVALWLKAPKITEGDGIIVDPPHWPQPDPRCPDLYRVQAPARLSIALSSAQGTQRPHHARIEIISSDPDRGRLSFPVDLDASSLDQRLGLRLPEASLINLTLGTYSPVVAPGSWHWIELLPSQFSEEQRVGMQQLAQLAQRERRNNRSALVVSVILGGPLVRTPKFEGGPLRLFLDERHAFHANLSRTPNGRYYPLRLLIDPQGRLVYFDQHIGLANAMARYRERERYFR